MISSPRPSFTSGPERLIDHGDKRSQERRRIFRIVREPHLDVRNARAKRSTHDTWSAEKIHALSRQRDAAAGGDEAERGVQSVRVVDDLRLQAGLAADRHEGIVVSRRKTPREQDEALATQRQQRVRAASRERMTFG